MTDMIENIFDKSLPALRKSLTMYRRRNDAIASNLANVETPGYRAVDLNFAGELERAFGQRKDGLLRTNGKHMDIGGEKGAHLVADNSGATKADGNNVDLDIQMARMVENSGQYGKTAAIVRKKLQMLRMAIMRSQT